MSSGWQGSGCQHLPAPGRRARSLPVALPSRRILASSCCRYRYLPQPKDFDGQRALDFVLDNQTLSDTNRTLLFDIKLLGAYPRQ